MSQQYTPFNIIWKKDFCHKCTFFTSSLKLPTLNNGQNLLVWRKFFVDAPLLDFVP